MGRFDLQTVIASIVGKICHLSTKIKDEIITVESKMLHDKFIVAPIDKAGGNVALVFQKHFATVLVKELGVNNVNNITSTWTTVTNQYIKL